MGNHGGAEISNYTGKDFTLVRFYPDFKLFKLKDFTHDIVQLFKKRAYDMAGIFNNNIKVYLNN